MNNENLSDRSHVVLVIRYTKTNATSTVVIVASFVRRPRLRRCDAPLGHFAITAPIVSAPAPLGRTLSISLLRHHMGSSPSARAPSPPSPSPPPPPQLRHQTLTYGGTSGFSAYIF